MKTLITSFVLVVSAITTAAFAWTPLPVAQDPLVRMPGTQPSQGVNLENPNRCLNCHAGYNPAGEPGFQWMGSMMAQAARDPMLYACMTVAAQDSIAVLGNPNAVDICERCHFPEGWLGGRSDPPNASAMTGSDFDGLHCDVCHRMWDPFFAGTYAGTRESNDWIGYWDEAGNTGPGSGTLSQTSADVTLTEDQSLALDITLFSGEPFFSNGRPLYGTYTENASGQYFMSPNAQKRASFADADARHQMLYSRYHKSKYFCGTCHDVSNPALANLGLSGLEDQSNGQDLITEQYAAGLYFHVERTFSEFLLSAYGQPGGADTNAEFRAQGAPDILHAAKCQDCHMRDIEGTAANKKGAVFRPSGSTEHPNSGLPLHDLTGGNSWISYILASLDPNGPVYDKNNVDILDQGPGVLTLDLNAGQTPKVNGAALKAGSDRAKQQLLLAATIKDTCDTDGNGEAGKVAYDVSTGMVSFCVQNNTGHKLISGFPEGRRMFVNVKAYDSDNNVIYEVNPYDYDPDNPNDKGKGTLKGLDHPDSPAAGANEVYVDELVYEVHPRSSLTDEDHTFHFVLADGRSKDNRIPPKGFDIANAATRHSEPVGTTFTTEEYDGGYDDQSVTIPTGIAPDVSMVTVSLYYQGTSREYISFLRDEINGTGGTLDPGAYIVQDDPFFTQLKAWGDTIWKLWSYNHGFDIELNGQNVPGSTNPVAGIVPFLMAEAAWTDPNSTPPPPDCTTPGTPQNLTATGAKRKVDLTWDAVNPAPPNGYRVYYDLAGKLQFVGTAANAQYTDTGLKPDSQVCYAVTSWNDCGNIGQVDTGEESAPSNVNCAIPTRH